MELGLGGRLAVVTGAGSGLGKATAVALAEEGATVVAADLIEEAAVETAHEIEGKGGSAQGRRIDVTERGQWSQLMQGLRRLGPVEILCNIAGPAGGNFGQLETDDAEWARQMDGHLKAVFLGCQSILPLMIERRYGKIVNMCSFASHGVLQTIPAYTAAFGGILAYTKALSRYAAPYNVNVNCVSPGNIQTPMTEATWLSRPGALQELRDRMPIKRVGQPEDIAAWFVFLASDRARHAVGIEVNVSGGQLI
ncbi:MAG TPA: SDR family oxidoreductase [Acidimicrobiales bacterium]|nr:SDR family oxidoreductase [Acidimicrobiales bacterium]